MFCLVLVLCLFWFGFLTVLPTSLIWYSRFLFQIRQVTITVSLPSSCHLLFYSPIRCLISRLKITWSHPLYVSFSIQPCCLSLNPFPALLCPLLRGEGQSSRQSPTREQIMNLYDKLQTVCTFCLVHLLGSSNLFNHCRLLFSEGKLSEEAYTNGPTLEGKGYLYAFDVCSLTFVSSPAVRITWPQLLADMISSLQMKPMW